MEIFIFWVLLSILAGVIASNKGRSGFGFFCLALFLSPVIGILAALVVESDADKLEDKAIESGDSKKCPDCAELIKEEAVICRYCGKEQKAQREAPVSQPVKTAEQYRREMLKNSPAAKWPWEL